MKNDENQPAIGDLHFWKPPYLDWFHPKRHETSTRNDPRNELRPHFLERGVVPTGTLPGAACRRESRLTSLGMIYDDI